jgi:glucan endo-1,3-alpha-glucosidase
MLVFQGFKYAATQAATYCFCGNSYDRYGAFPGGCTMACAADSSQTCGGGFANQVYDVTEHPGE